MKKLTLIFILPLLLFSCSKSPKSNPTPTGPVVTTLAGNGIGGLQDGTLAAAEFNFPIDIAIDKSGVVYIADQGNNVIRKITPAGVTTFAGSGTAGFKNGTGTAAQFNSPQGIVIDQTGNLYVADSQNNVIRQITPNGVVTTYAGNGTPGLVNGAATSAEFATPSGLAIDKSRNIFVTDFSNNVVREISSGGVVSTFAGSGAAGNVDGAAASAKFHNPSGITIDGNNNLFVAEYGNGTIRQITQSGDVSTYASNLTGPVRVAADLSGNLFVSDGNVIKEIKAGGTINTYAGNGSPGLLDGPALQAEFNSPSGLALDITGNIFVTDYGNNRIRVVSL